MLARQRRFLIDPRKSKWLTYWDGVTAVALVYTAIVTPAECALFDAAKSMLEPLFLVNRVLDGIFLFDMSIQFRLMVQKTHTASEGAVWLSKPSAIAHNYLHSWFALDLISILVSGFDFVGLDIVLPLLGGGGPRTDAASNLKVLRVLRVLRMIKLARLVRSSRVIRRIETRMAVNYGMLALMKAMGTMVMMGHMIACVWVLQARLQGDLTMTWLGRLEYCVPVVEEDRGLMSLDPTPSDWECPPLVCYLGGLYYAAATITSIGYGDITPTHHNVAETTVAVILMFGSCTVWAHLIGVFSGVVSGFNPDRVAFRAMMDGLNRFMHREGIPKELARRTREFFHESHHLRTAEQQRQLMDKLPPSLQGEVSWSTNSAWLQAIRFLKGAEPQYLVELSQQVGFPT